MELQACYLCHLDCAQPETTLEIENLHVHVTCAYLACLKDKANQDPVFILADDANSETNTTPSLEFTLFPELETPLSPCPTLDELLSTPLDTPFDVPTSPSYDVKPEPLLISELSSTTNVRNFHPSRFALTTQMRNTKAASVKSLMKRIQLSSDNVEQLIQYYLIGLLLHEQEQTKYKHQVRTKRRQASITSLKKWFKDSIRKLDIGRGIMDHFRIARRTHALLHTRGVEQFSRIKSLTPQDVLEASSSQLNKAYQISCSLGKYQGPFDFSTHL